MALGELEDGGTFSSFVIMRAMYSCMYSKNFHLEKCSVTKGYLCNDESPEIIRIKVEFPSIRTTVVFWPFAYLLGDFTQG